jgi:hypothetical protein
LEKPIAAGDITSDFEIEKLNTIIDKDLIDFSKGRAKISFRYRGDIVNYELSKPFVEGSLDISGANVNYRPRNLDFKDISVRLNIDDDNLSIGNIHLKTGKSIVDMNGSIDNFLNLYYTSPEKIILKWNINSPELHLGEFMGFLSSRKKGVAVKKAPTRGNFTEELDLLFDKSNVDMNVRIAKLNYNKFYATDATADLLLTDAGLIVRNAGLKHAGGTVMLNGTLIQAGNLNNYNLKATVSKVDIKKFFASFNNFGMETLTAQNLQGALSTRANLSGQITDGGVMVERSMRGSLDFNLQKGALLNFEPVRNVGKFAFPFRDMNNIDIQGVYSFGRGTEIYVAVPLRNPKKDEEITDEKELAKRRNRGVVVNLVAKDGSDGKVKLGLGKKKV